MPDTACKMYIDMFFTVKKLHMCMYADGLKNVRDCYGNANPAIQNSIQRLPDTCRFI